jgi:hypothetical protein
MNPDFKKKLFQLLDATPEVEDTLVEQDESLREVRDTLHAAIRNVVPRDPWAYWVSRGLDAMEQERTEENLPQGGFENTALPAAPDEHLASGSGELRTAHDRMIRAAKSAFDAFYRDCHEAHATAERLIAICQLTNTSYRTQEVPRISIVPWAHDGSSPQVRQDDDSLEIAVPAEEWPFGLCLLCVFESNAQNTEVEMVTLMARNIRGRRFVRRPWSNFTNIKRSVANQVVTIPATEKSIGMFQKATVQNLHDTCNDPELKQLIADFLKLFSDGNESP